MNNVLANVCGLGNPKLQNTIIDCYCEVFGEQYREKITEKIKSTSFFVTMLSNEMDFNTLKDVIEKRLKSNFSVSEYKKLLAQNFETQNGLDSCLLEIDTKMQQTENIEEVPEGTINKAILKEYNISLSLYKKWVLYRDKQIKQFTNSIESILDRCKDIVDGYEGKLKIAEQENFKEIMHAYMQFLKEIGKLQYYKSLPKYQDEEGAIYSLLFALSKGKDIDEFSDYELKGLELLGLPKTKEEIEKDKLLSLRIQKLQKSVGLADKKREAVRDSTCICFGIEDIDCNARVKKDILEQLQKFIKNQTGSVAACAIQYNPMGGKDVKSVLALPIDTLCDDILIHEIIHSLFSHPWSGASTGFEVRDSIDNEGMTDEEKKDYIPFREFEAINEIVTEWLTVKVMNKNRQDAKIMFNANKFSSLYQNAFPIMAQFLEVYQEDIVKSLFNNPYDFIEDVGYAVFDYLASLTNRLLMYGVITNYQELAKAIIDNMLTPQGKPIPEKLKNLDKATPKDIIEFALKYVDEIENIDYSSSAVKKLAKSIAGLNSLCNDLVYAKQNNTKVQLSIGSVRTF